MRRQVTDGENICKRHLIKDLSEMYKEIFKTQQQENSPFKTWAQI